MDHPSLNDLNQADQASRLKLSLRGKLTKMVGLSFLTTDNLASHLHPDVDKVDLDIFITPGS